MPSAARAALPWPDVGDDDAETIELEAAKDERRSLDVREGCDSLLAALMRHERRPAEIARPDIDRKYVPLTLKDAP
jgi:hypothetical protein